jgi:hypothetical protein
MNTMQIRFEAIALALRSVPQGTPLEQATAIAEAIYQFVTKDEPKDQPPQ